MVVPERVMQTADGELSPASLLDYGACILKQQHARQHVPAVQELARPSWVRPKAFRLGLRPAPQEGIHL